MSNTPRPTRSQQREEARAKARDLREKRASGEKRKKLLVTMGIALGIVLAVAGVGFALVTPMSAPTRNARQQLRRYRQTPLILVAFC